MLACIVQVTVFPAAWPPPLLDVHSVAAAYAPLLTETNHEYEYGGNPVEGRVLLMVSTSSESSAADNGMGVDAAVSGECTMTFVDAGDVAVDGLFALSVTFSSKL